ncbi:MAG: YqeG family HAD IIIA-type phosphatase [Bacillota bacterium]|nr:MAG: YqeG family HAD IIIA-type phosphatase [Bacillota bacterium]
MRLLRPAEWHPSIHSIDVKALRARGIRAVMVDLDNTLVAWRYPRPTPAVLEWFDRLRAEGIKVCIVSNGGSRRVEAFARQAGVPFIGSARKPRSRGFRRALALLGTRPSETAVVGDQLFTDILGGNLLGLYTILVAPVSRREFIGTRLVRVVERLVLGYMRRRGYLGSA